MNIMSPLPRIEHGNLSGQSRQHATVDGILSRIRRQSGVFVPGLVAPLAVAVAVLVFAQPVYVANGSVMVGDQEPSSGSASPAWLQKLGDPADMESQLLILKSSRMLRLVLSRPGVLDALRRECELGGTLPTSEGAASSCRTATFESPVLLRHIERRYGAQAIGRSRVISIGYTSPLPDVAFIMANAMLVSYLEDQRAQNAQSRSLAAGWILKEGERAEGDASTKRFYSDLYKQVSDLETERRMLLNGGRLVSLAEVPSLPYFPKVAPVLAAGLTLGLILGSLAALFKDMTDGRVRRTSELAATTGLPVLGKIPLAGGRRRSLRSVLAGSALASKQGEYFLPLYAQLIQGGNTHQKRVLVTSAVPLEGKSFVALGLARFAAAAGKKVLLIDCNLRRPAIADAVMLAGKLGLADVLRGSCAPADAIQPTSVVGLDVMPAGEAGSDLAMLLIDGQPMRKLDEIDGYDLILLDGPASDRLFESLVFARHADAILWCVRWGATLTADVTGTLDGLSDARDKVAGLALTMTERRRTRLFERDTASVTSVARAS